MNKVLITGANGFVGSHMIEYILENHPDYLVCCMYRSHTTSMKNVEHISDDRITWVQCDLTEQGSIEEVFEQHAPFDKIFHLAAQSYVPESFNRPGETIRANVIGTINLLEAVRKHNKDAVVMICSSSEVYGHQVNTPTKETEPFDPISPYALSKVGQDLTCKMYAKVYGLKTYATRAFTHSGARRGEVFFISAFAKQVANIEKGLQEPIINVGNLESYRTIMHAKDCINGYWMLSENAEWGESYNLGGSELWKVDEVLQYLITELYEGNKPIVVNVSNELIRPKDVNMQVPDTTKFKERCPKWEPKILVKDVIKDVLDYWRKELA